MDDQKRLRKLLTLVSILLGVVIVGYIAARPSLVRSNVSEQPSLEQPQQVKHPLHRVVTVNTYQINLTCAGEGSPTVILDSYLPSSATTWVAVRPNLAAVTRVCTYERTDGTFRRLTSQQIVADLHNVLQQVPELSGPYILVGWGFGGYNVRLYAQRYATEVAGLVLVDTNHEDYFKVFRSLIPSFPEDDEGEETQLEHELSGEVRAVVDYEASAGQVGARKTSFGSLPLMVVQRGRPDWPMNLPVDVRSTLQSTWQKQQASLTTLSSNSALITADQSSHNIPQDQPDVVVDAIRRVVEAVRSHAPLVP